MKKEKVVNISNKESFIVFLDVVQDQINNKELDRKTDCNDHSIEVKEWFFIPQLYSDFKISVDTKSTDVLFLKQQQQQQKILTEQFWNCMFSLIRCGASFWLTQIKLCNCYSMI